MTEKILTAATGKVLVSLIPTEGVSEGGIIIPEQAREKSVRGYVESVGKDVRVGVSAGDVVVLKDAYAGALVGTVGDGAEKSDVVAVEPDEILAVLA